MAASQAEVYERVKEVLTEQLGIEEANENEPNATELVPTAPRDLLHQRLRWIALAFVPSSLMRPMPRVNYSKPTGSRTTSRKWRCTLLSRI